MPRLYNYCHTRLRGNDSDESQVSRPINIDTTMLRIAAMLCRRDQRVPDPAARGFAPGDDFDIVQCTETNGSRH